MFFKIYWPIHIILTKFLVDNVIRYGLVADPDYTSEEVEGIRHFVKYVQTDDTVEATTISTVGQKGYDGFMYILKL